MMLGACAGLLWATWKTAVLIINRISPQPVKSEALITALLSSTAAALIALDAVIPLVIRYIRNTLRRMRTAQHHRDLEPLWREVHQALPEIELTPVELGEEDFGVYHRMIEIRDANLALRVHFHPKVRSWVIEATHHQNITGDELEVIIEASVIAGAIEAHAAGVRYHTDPSTAETPHIGTGDITTERDRLIRVSQAFAHDPVVQQMRERVREDANSTIVGGR